ncbi:Putative AAA+ ATPase domain, tetratricopeptide-like helical domain superfamily [Colletotrichum destructivum]|uniref:AAA+ ATPase domain, tetratricopeptide-like helical domain superfamily n=1 Tax=Colletotrichum destructivum TaxID=34406 RepID=A0AAX4I021_9PEZI|nr:Putative AAA+ ATPase domain, tetratricopeptide-like helical domain superfamily [Colletotrichum destructivum]
MDPQMAFNGPLRGQSVVAGMSVSGGTANVHFHHAANNPPQTAPLRVLPFSRNEDVVVRPGIFSQLAQLLPVSEARHAALCGLGGSGKTQVALEFAYRRADDDSSCAIFWVHADTEATFTQDYALIARKAGLSAPNSEELLTAVCHFIETQPRWLLVLDNADNLRLFGVGVTPSSEQASSKSLNSYVPKGPTGSILWTSRDGRIAGSLVGPMRAIQITSMLPLEAQTLLVTARGSNLKDDELDDAVALLSELHYIPLPVSQAASYIRRTAMPIKKYLSRLRDGKKRWALLKKTDFDRHRREGVSNSILETWNITIELLNEEDKTAVKILHILAYFDNQNIPRKMIKAVAAAAVATADTFSEVACEDNDGSWDVSCAESESDEDPEGDDQDAGDGDDIPHVTTNDSDKGEEDAKDTIDAPSYAAGHSDNIEEVTTDSDNTTDDSDEDTSDSDDSTEDALTRLREFSFLHMTTRPDGKQVYDMHKLVQEATLYSHGVEKNSSSNASHSQMAIRILTNLFPERKRETWEDCETLIPHVMRLSRCAKIPGQELPISNLLGRASDYLYDRGRWSEREVVDELVYSLRLMTLGQRHLKTIKSMTQLGVTYHGQGRYRESERISAEVLKLHQEVLGPRHPQTLRSMAELATTYHSQGRLEESENIKTEVLELQREVLGRRHPETINSMAQLAITYHNQGRYEESENITTEALELSREVLGPRHPETIKNMAELATTYHNQGRYEESENITTEVLELRQEILGPRHPETIKIMADLAITFYAQGRYKESENITTEALGLLREFLGARHPRTINTMFWLARCWNRQGRDEEAMALMNDCYRLHCDVLGPEHPYSKEVKDDVDSWVLARREAEHPSG